MASGLEMAPALTVLMIPKEPEESTAFFRYQVMKTPDPRDCLRARAHLPPGRLFSGPRCLQRQAGVRAVCRAPRWRPRCSTEGECILAFEQGRQRYQLPCKVRELKPGSAAREAAIWHNRLFNPALPDTVHVLGFNPIGLRPGPIHGPAAESHAPPRICDTPCSTPLVDGLARSGSGQAAPAPTCLCPVDCQAAPCPSECAPSH